MNRDRSFGGCEELSNYKIRKGESASKYEKQKSEVLRFNKIHGGRGHAR